VQKLAELQQFIVNPQQLLEGVVVDHHKMELRKAATPNNAT
jgi:hypothetical protein